MLMATASSRTAKPAITVRRGDSRPARRPDRYAPNMMPATVGTNSAGEMLIRNDHAHWGKIIKAAGIRAD